MSYGGPCMFCGETVQAERAAFPVRGFETRRTGGGANRILMRERVPGQIAHITCAVEEAERRRRGIAAGQESLL